MSDCIFCAIVDGDIPGRIVHEIDQSLTFLDVNPFAPGHTLVVPEEHHVRLDEMPTDAMADLFAAVNDLVPHVEAVVDADVMNIDINNGPAAGQGADRVHVHIVPWFEGGDGGPIYAVAGERPDLSDEELTDIEAAISG